jgi:hypothetical protein
MLRPPSSLNPSIVGNFSFSNDKGKSQIYDLRVQYGYPYVQLKVTGGGVGEKRKR